MQRLVADTHVGVDEDAAVGVRLGLDDRFEFKVLELHRFHRWEPACLGHFLGGNRFWFADVEQVRAFFARGLDAQDAVLDRERLGLLLACQPIRSRPLKSVCHSAAKRVREKTSRATSERNWLMSGIFETKQKKRE